MGRNDVILAMDAARHRLKNEQMTQPNTTATGPPVFNSNRQGGSHAGQDADDRQPCPALLTRSKFRCSSCL